MPQWQRRAGLYDAIFVGLVEHWKHCADLTPNQEQQASLVPFAGEIVFRL